MHSNHVAWSPHVAWSANAIDQKGRSSGKRQEPPHMIGHVAITEVACGTACQMLQLHSGSTSLEAHLVYRHSLVEWLDAVTNMSQGEGGGPATHSTREVMTAPLCPAALPPTHHLVCLVALPFSLHRASCDMHPALRHVSYVMPCSFRGAHGRPCYTSMCQTSPMQQQATTRLESIVECHQLDTTSLY